MGAEGILMAESAFQRGEGLPFELLERSDDVELLNRAFERAKLGAGGTIMICGTAGIGKTSLVHAFVGQLGDEATVFQGGCDDLIAPRSFGPFRDMARTSGLLSDEMAVNPNREDLLSDLLTILNRPSCPAVMVIEDAHWADDASIDVMRYLARRIVSMHAMVIVTLREGEVNRDHPVRRLLTGPTSTAPIRLDLRPLSLDAVCALAQGSALEPEYVHLVSGGNPFLVREMFAADHEDATRSARETLVARAERLTPAGRSVLQILSVLPEGADPSVARMLFGDEAGALHEAEGSGLLESTTDRIRFQHELGRNAVISAMSFSERMAATNKVLTALVEVGADPTSLVHISRAAGDGRRATRFALDILDHGLAPNNHREAWQLTCIALECTTDLSPGEVAALHLSAAKAGRATNNHADAVEHAEKAIAILGEDGTDDAALASAWLTLAIMRRAAGDNNRAIVALRNAKERLDHNPGTEEWLQCNTLLAASALIGGEIEESVDLASQSIELAEANGWMHGLVYALGVRGVARGGPATPEGRSDMEQATRLGAVHGPPDRHAANLHNLSVLHLRNGDTAEAEQLVDEAERYSQEHGLDNLLFHSQVQRAHVYIQQGRTADAETIITDCMEAASDPGSIRASADAALARILGRRGEPSAGELVEQAWSEALATGEVQKIAVAGITRMEYLWLQGEDESLRQLARHLAELGHRHQHHRLRADALRTLMRLGEEVEPFDGCPAPLAAALGGDHRRAAELWEDAGQPYERALELVESIDASFAFEGLRLLDRTGATRTADLVRYRLRSRGFHGVPRGPRKSSDGGVPVLTDRQIDVLRLIAQGLTNQEIADELFVARRTVDNHVSAILNRLGVEGRHEAVQEAVTRDLINCDQPAVSNGNGGGLP
jgi:DNA-binding CsgD family transcriptional regulator/tetratricopeptide (TPR) repeat protein